MPKIGALPAVLLLAASTTVFAQTPDPCAGLWGFALGQCRANQQKLQQQQQSQQQEALEQQAAQQRIDQQRRQDQDEQQRQIQNQQLENLKLQNEILHKQLDQTKPQSPENSPEFKSWQAANPWFGSDKAKTEFAVLYAKQLRQDQPDLVGRRFWDAVTAKVGDTFGSSSK
jgi:hypothetical protein